MNESEGVEDWYCSGELYWLGSRIDYKSYESINVGDPVTRIFETMGYSSTYLVPPSVNVLLINGVIRYRIVQGTIESIDFCEYENGGLLNNGDSTGKAPYLPIA